MEPIHFVEFYGDATPRPGDIIALIGLDGISRARRAGRQYSSGQSVEGGRLLAEQKAHPAGDYLAPGRFDGVRRFYSFRTLRDYPLIVTVGVAGQYFWLHSSARPAANYLGRGLVSPVR